MTIKQALLLSGLAAVSTMTVRAWRRITPGNSVEETLQRNIRIHNYVHEVESGIAYADYVKRISPVTRAAYELMGVPFDESKLLHSQMGRLTDDDLVYLLAMGVTHHLDPVGYTALVGKPEFQYDIQRGRFVYAGHRDLDELIVGYTVTQLIQYIDQPATIFNANQDHSVRQAMIGNIHHLSKYMKEAS